jgi:hypothetical protein
MDVLEEEVREFQLKLEGILKEFLEQGRIEVYGNLKIVVTSFDRSSRIAFLKGNTIYVNIKARRYPEFLYHKYQCQYSRLRFRLPMTAETITAERMSLSRCSFFIEELRFLRPSLRYSQPLLFSPFEQ